MGGLIAVSVEGIREGLMARSGIRDVFDHGAALLIPHVSLVAGYCVIAVLVAALVLVAADWVRPAEVAGPRYAVLLSLAAGMLWPVLCIGLVQLAVLAVLRHLALMADRPNRVSLPAVVN